MTRFLTIFCLLLTTGCASISLGSLWSLSRINPWDINPEEARIAIGFSEPMPEGAVLLDVTASTVSGEEATLAVTFDQLTSEDEISAVQFPVGVQQAFVLKVPESELGAVTRFLQFMRENSSNGNSGTTDVSVTWQMDDLPEGADCEALAERLKVYSALQVSREDGYIPLTRGSYITRLINGSKAALCQA